MLQRDDAFETTERVYRVTLNPERWRTLDRIRRELGDETQIAEALAFLGEPSDLDPTTLPDLLRDPFHRTPFPSDRRFSNGEFGVLYTARTAQTAGYEYAHWAPRNFAPAPGEPVRVRLHLISAMFQGRVIDVCPFVDQWPWLIPFADPPRSRRRAAGQLRRHDGPGRSNVPRGERHAATQAGR